MSDKELLEQAAMAFGLIGEAHLLYGDCNDPEEPGGFRYELEGGGHAWWNPLMDTDDAMQLAAKFEMMLTFSVLKQAGACASLGEADVQYVDCGGDEVVSMRRAIVIAAVREMELQGK